MEARLTCVRWVSSSNQKQVLESHLSTGSKSTQGNNSHLPAEGNLIYLLKSIAVLGILPTIIVSDMGISHNTLISLF